MIMKPEACSPQFEKPSFPTKESFSANMPLAHPCQTEPGYKALVGREGKSVHLSSLGYNRLLELEPKTASVYIFSWFLGPALLTGCSEEAGPCWALLAAGGAVSERLTCMAGRLLPIWASA